VVVLMVDATQEISDQDAHIAGFIIDAGRALVVAVNKWDAVDDYRREQIKLDIARKLNFLGFARVHYVSALKGQGIAGILGSVDKAYAAAMAKMSTPKLTPRPDRRHRKTDAAAPWRLPSQAALRPPGRQQSAGHCDSRQCAGAHTGFLYALSRTLLPRGLQAAGHAAAHPVQDQQEPLCRRRSADEGQAASRKVKSRRRWHGDAKSITVIHPKNQQSPKDHRHEQ
jgi:hypothetical protein